MVFWVVIALALEKILQHGLTALFFAVNIEGIGTPDVGTRIVLGNPIMAALNLVLMALFVWGCWDTWRLRSRGLGLLIALSVFDIVAEFVFHGFVLITVSVVVAVSLIVSVLVLRSTMAKPAPIQETA